MKLTAPICLHAFQWKLFTVISVGIKNNIMFELNLIYPDYLPPIYSESITLTFNFRRKLLIPLTDYY